MTETTIGIRELKTHLSEYIREIKKGRTISITEHGKTIGRMIPAGASVESRMEALHQSGLVRWNGKKINSMKPIAAMHGLKTISELISEARE